MSMQIVARTKAPEQPKTILLERATIGLPAHVREILALGGHVDLESHGDLWVASIMDRDGRRHDNATCATPEGALRAIGVIPPLVCLAPGSEGGW